MRKLWWHVTGQTWLRQSVLCRFGRHKFVEWATYDGPDEWCRYSRRVRPARRTFIACANPSCRAIEWESA